MSEERPNTLVGRTVDDRYRLEARIGAGGLGEVFRARHLRMERSFAIKLLQPNVATQADFIERFDREAKALSRLSHPYCVEVTDYGVCRGCGPYLVMELLEGTPLSGLTKGDKGAPPKAALPNLAELPLGQSLDLCRKILIGLEHAHGQGIAHRDLKPDNIMVVRDPVDPGALLPKILDFGLAKIHAGDAESSALTQAGLIIGTPYYMSPERIADAKNADAMTGDLYAMGVILYELCCGRRPFVGSDMMATLTMHLTAAPRPPRELCPALPSALEQLVLRSLEKHPSERYSSAREHREALEALLPLDGAAAALPSGAAAHVSGEAETVSASLPGLATHTTPAPPPVELMGLGRTASTRVESPVATKPASPKAKQRRVPLWALGVGALALVAAGAVVTLVLTRDGPTSAQTPSAGTSDQGQPKAAERRASEPAPRRAAAPRHETKPTIAPELKRAARLWARKRSRRAVRLFGRYLARHRKDAQGHLFVARLYLLRLWANDGVETLQYALAADPELILDDTTLVGLAFAYRSKRRGAARRLLLAHAGRRAPRVLLAAAAAIRDKDLSQRQLDDARSMGMGQSELDKALVALTMASTCTQRKTALAAVTRHRDPLVDVLLSIVERQRCLRKAARRYIGVRR